MEEWCVAGSGSEEDEESATNYLDFGGIRIPPHRLLHLMQSVHMRKTLELDSLSGVYRNKRLKKKKKKKPRLSGGDSKTVEETSETASEIRSTTCTSTTATESRDMRRQKYDFDDPELDDNTLSSSSKPSIPTKIKKAPPPIHKKEKQLARLDKIAAEKMKRKQRWDLSKTDNAHSLVPKQLNSGPSQINTGKHLESALNSRGELPNHGLGDEVEEMEVDGQEPHMVTFDDEESTNKGDSESDSDMKFSLLPQINKVEQLLDFEVS